MAERLPDYKSTKLTRPPWYTEFIDRRKKKRAARSKKARTRPSP